MEIVTYRRQPERRFDPRRRHSHKSRLAEQIIDQARLAETEQSTRLIGVAWWQAGMLEGSRNENCDARILLGRRKHHAAKPAAGFERAENGTQCFSRVGKEHQAKSANRGVEMGLFDGQRLAVGGERLHIVMTSPAGVLFAELE